MTNRSTSTVAALLLACPLCFGALREPQVGLEVTAEASARLRGGSGPRDTANGLALLHAAWPESEAPSTGPIAWSGYVSVLGLAGHGPTERCLGDFLAASNIEGYRSVRLYSWWLEGRAGDWSLRAGALLADEEFTGTESGAQLINSAQGWPAFISANTVNTGPAFFVAAPGLRLARTWGETAAWRLGVYDGDSFDSAAGDPRPTRHGLHYRVGGDQGWFVITEAEFAPAARTRVKLGGWLHTATFPDLYADASGRPFATTGAEPRGHHGNHGAYVSLEQIVAGRPGEPGAVQAHVRAGFAPADRSPLSSAIDAGVAWTGPLPGRPADVLAVGYARGNFSDDYAAAARLADPTVAAPDFEQVLELTYHVELTPRLTLQPDLQFIRHPGGTPAPRDIVAAFLRLSAAF